MGLIGLLMFKDAERQLHQFAHGSAQGGHLGFAPGQQALVGWARPTL